MDRHLVFLLGRAVGALLGVSLLFHYWSGGGEGAGNNLFLNAALLVCLVIVLFDDRLIVEQGPLVAARITSLAGLFGIALVAFWPGIGR